MPAFNVRPAAIDLFYYPGNPVTLTFTYPVDFLDPLTFKAYLNGTGDEGMEGEVTVLGDVMTVYFTGGQTASVGYPVDFLLGVFTDGDPDVFEPQFVGVWTPGTDGFDSPVVADFTVNTPLEVFVDVSCNAAGPAGPAGPTGPAGADGADGVVQSVVAGSNVTVNSADPANPIVSSTGGLTGIRVEDEGSTAVAAATALNFAGTAVTVTDAGSDEALVTITGGALRVEDEGSTVVAAATGMNFAGSAVTVTDAGSNEALVTITGGALRVEDEGSTIVAAATGMNFAGAGVVVTDAGSNEALVTISGGSGGGSVVFDEARRASGNISLSSTSWANVDTGLDLSIPASVGDVVQVNLAALVNSENTAAEFDVVSVVSGSPVNSWLTGGTPGENGWYAGSSAYASLGGSVSKTLVSGDLSSGTLTLRLRYKWGGGGSNKTLFASSARPFVWSCQILGATSGGALRVEDEGSTVVAAATGMNFAGDGVVVTDAGSNEALVTIAASGGGGGGGILATGRATRASSNLTLNSTSVTNLDTGMDITMSPPAGGGFVAGDVLRVYMSGVYGTEDVASNLYAATIVSGSPVNYVTSGTSSAVPVQAWSKELTTEDYQPIAGGDEYVLQSGDISGGNVMIRLRYKTGSASNLTLFASSASPLKWWADIVRPGVGSISPERQSAVVATGQSTTSTSYTDLSTVGPSITIMVPSSGKLTVDLGCYLQIPTNLNGEYAIMSFALSGANTLAAADANALYIKGIAGATAQAKVGITTDLTGLTPGSTTITAKYRTVGGNSCTFTDRTIAAGIAYQDNGTASLLAVHKNTASGNVSTTSATQADIDATNAAITFTAPASGNVLVRVTYVGAITANNVNTFLGLRESTTNLVNGTTGTVAVQGQSGTALEGTYSWVAYLTGVTAGSHTYKVSSATNGGTFTVRGSANSPMTIEVWSAP